MDTLTAIVLSSDSHCRDKITGVLQAASVSVLTHPSCTVQMIEDARKYRPHIAVLATNAFTVEGIHLIRQIRNSDRGAKIIVLTQQDPFHFSARYSRAGASVLLRTRGDMRGLAFIVQAIRSGYGYFDFIHMPIRPRERSFASETDLIATLTDRELIVFQGLAAGLSNQAIAEEMNVGSRYVSVHKTNIFEKLQQQSISQLIEMALRNKLI